MYVHRIKLQNILSFGPDVQELELMPLNVLIGPNGSGKSNLIEVIGLLRAAPLDWTVPIREGGGFDYWIWRGEPRVSEMRVEVVAAQSYSTVSQGRLRYSLAFDSLFRSVPEITEELTRDPSPEAEDDDSRYLERRHGKIVLSCRNENGARSRREIPIADVVFHQSVLAQLKDPVQYPELTLLGNELLRMCLYRKWFFGRDAPPRLPQKADLPNKLLAEDGHNLGMVLNRLKKEPAAKNTLLDALRQLYEGIEDIETFIEAGTVQIFLQEGDIMLPATRLSDGTLRYLNLLAILCDPTPPPVICLEEPELGLHPDIIPSLVELLREASQRCQLIVTTHSDILVDALTDTPESVVVCEKENGQTRMRRLDKQDLAVWLGRYSLGDYWMRGGLGGTRW